jgi:hypothetical protein
MNEKRFRECLVRLPYSQPSRARYFAFLVHFEALSSTWRPQSLDGRLPRCSSLQLLGWKVTAYVDEWLLPNFYFHLITSMDCVALLAMTKSVHRVRQAGMTGKSLRNFRNRVKPGNQKYSAFVLTQISFITPPVSRQMRGARDRHERAVRCGGR